VAETLHLQPQLEAKRKLNIVSGLRSLIVYSFPVHRHVQLSIRRLEQEHYEIASFLQRVSYLSGS